MAKRCPSCGYGPIGPFTDNCPICAEPVRNVRSSSGGFGGPRSMPPVVQWILGGVIIGLLSVGGCCGLGMWRMGNAIQDAQKAMEQARADAEAERLARTVPVEAEPLLQEFQKDPAAADRKYLGKCLEVTGVVERSGRGRDRVPFVILRGGDEKAKLRIECFFEVMTDVEDAKVRRLGTGQTITVRGEYDGQVSNVQLRECVLVK